MTKRGSMRTDGILCQCREAVLQRALHCLIAHDSPMTAYKIMFAAETNHREFKRYVEIWIQNGLIDRTEDGRYTITDKGTELLYMLDKQAELLGSKVYWI